MSPAGKAATPATEGVDSAAPVSTDVKTTPAPAKTGKGKGGGKGPPSSRNKAEPTSSKNTPGFAEGNAVLSGYGLSLSGYRERILSPFKTEKFFHMISTSYQRLLSVKPTLNERFTYEEFLHCSALQLFHRIENVKFDALGVKPSAAQRVPLPRNLRVFQPIWSILSNIGTVVDEELRVEYIPDGVLPDSDDLDSEHDIEGLLSCCLYDWKTSWADVIRAREQRDSWQSRDGYVSDVDTNEFVRTKEELIKAISDKKRSMNSIQQALDDERATEIKGRVYFYPYVSDAKYKELSSIDGFTMSNYSRINEKWYETGVSDSDIAKTTAYNHPDSYRSELETLFQEAKLAKKRRITPRFDAAYAPESYKISDGTISSSPGAYGSRMHWDPQLWLDYENFVNEVAPLAMFSLSMPVETVGTYAWILPVEKRTNNEASMCAKLPKATIPTQTWVLSLLIQSSTLPLNRRSTWYTESDSLSNLTGLRQKYIQAAIKSGTAVDQFGTY